MSKDWPAVAAAVRNRMAELDMTQAEFIHKSRLAPMTIRNLLEDEPPRKATRPTLATASEALGWPRDRLERILNGEAPPDPDADDKTIGELGRMRRKLAKTEDIGQLAEAIAAINRRLDRIEKQLVRRQADDDERP